MTKNLWIPAFGLAASATTILILIFINLDGIMHTIYPYRKIIAGTMGVLLLFGMCFGFFYNVLVFRKELREHGLSRRRP